MSGVSAAVDKVAFSLPVGGVSEPIHDPDDATVIVRVAERDDGHARRTAERQETFRAELLSERRGRFFSSYMAKAKERMRIEIRDDVVRRMLAATNTGLSLKHVSCKVQSRNVTCQLTFDF